MLYPLKLIPQFFPKIWGGKKIKNIFPNAENQSNIGECWTVSGIEGSESIVENGFLAENTLAELAEVYLGDLVGDKVFDDFGENFPLLVKVIDAAQNLSIQVHPNDEIAAERHDCLGKNELWYILDAEPDAFIIAGFNKKITEREYIKAVKENRLESFSNKISVKKDDVIFIPAGCVHAIGKGCLLLEIQQSSDITYRIYDYDRVDENGKKRELHTDLAVDAIDFDNWRNCLLPTQSQANHLTNIIENEYFTINILEFDKEFLLDLSDKESFTLLSAVEGNVVCKYKDYEIEIKFGETILLPVELNSVILIPYNNAKILITNT
ncbi:MAG: class I mannose-6-phosphate isomerase [Prevotellaceae bacterium]|jgi:mannose-6-phosphate isomerase|nr:class I mannose-6-phosphate isomerase [Prevotellaceae bacterium]